MVDPLAGVLISTRYRLIGQLGSGETGTVWDARDEQLNLPVAIKGLRTPEPGSQQQLAELLELVRAEARYTGQLAHSNIVAVYDVVTDFDRAWVIMPRVNGHSLAAEIADSGTWDPARAARLGLQLVEALEAAHAEGVVHGAVKPSNVLIPQFGGPMLTDFSLTPSPPEADLLGLGAVMYFAVEGHAPQSASPEPPRNAGPITETIEGLLASDPSRRTTLAQARDQLTAALAAIAEQRRKAQSAAYEDDAPPAAPIAIPLPTGPITIPLARAADAPLPDATPSRTPTPPSLADTPPSLAAASAPISPASPPSGQPGSPPPSHAGSPTPGHAGSPAPGHAGPPAPGHAGPPAPGHAGPPAPGHAGPPAPGHAGPPAPGHAGSPAPAGESVSGHDAAGPLAGAAPIPQEAVAAPSFPGSASPLPPASPALPKRAPAIGRASAPPGLVVTPPAPAPSTAGGNATPATTTDPAAAPLARGYVMAAPARSPLEARLAPAPEAVAQPASGPAAASQAAAPPAAATQDPIGTASKASRAEPVSGSTATSPAPDPAPSTAPSVRGHAAAPPNRRRLVIATAVIVAVAAVIGVAFVFLRSPGTEAARPQATTSTPPAPDTTPPQQPTNVTVSGRSTDMVTLAWDAGVDNVAVTEYRVQRDGTQVGTTSTPDYTDKGLAVNTTHTYTVTAVDAAGNVSVASAEVAATTLKNPDTTKPSAPGNLRVTGRSTNSIVLGWTAATDDVGVARYEVRRDGRAIARVASLQYTDTGLTPATSYSYVVVAIDATGNISNPTAPVTGVTLTAPDTTAPSAPGSLHVTVATTTTIGLAWTASTDNTGVTKYLVYRNGVLVASPTALTHTDPGLTPGTTYSYQVKATDGAGNVSAAAVISAATVAPQVSALNTEVSIGAVPACTVTVTANVAVTTGPVTVNLQVIINGVTTTKSVSFTGTGPASQVVNVGTGSGTQDGTAQVSSTSPNSMSSTKTWTAPTACQPGFTVSSPTAEADSCGPPTISGSVRVTTRNNPGPEQYTVQMVIDDVVVTETTITLSPNSFDVVNLTSPDTYPNGDHTVSYVVTLQGGSSATSSTVIAAVNC